MEIKVLVVNVAKAKRGEDTGEFFFLPMDEEELNEKLDNLLGNDEKYAIIEYEAPFKIDKESYLHELNMQVDRFDATSYISEEIIGAIIDNSYDFDEAYDILNDGNYRIFRECEDMEDVAREVMMEDESFSEIPNHLQKYFDYKSYGDYLDRNGTFIKIENKTIYLELSRD